MVYIDGISFGEIVVDGKTYFSDVIVYWNGSVEMIPKKHLFERADFDALRYHDPDTIILGCAETGGVVVDGSARMAAEKEHIDLFIEHSPQAMRLFNSLVAAKRKVIAVFHTT